MYSVFELISISINFVQDKFSENLSQRLLQVACALCEPIAGVIDVKSGERISIKEAEKRRLIDRTSAQRLLEAQVCLFVVHL